MGKYSVRDVFVTLQGEGARAGSKAVFVRFAGCNLWNGNPADRSKGAGACASWCDTDFAKGAPHTTEALVERMNLLWDADLLEAPVTRCCVLSGGEPTLQVDAELLEALDRAGWFVAMETNGTQATPRGVDWLTVSPKLQADGSPPKLVVESANELKVVVPGVGSREMAGWSEAALLELEQAGNWGFLYLQPQDPINPERVEASYLHSSTSLSSRSLYELRAEYEASVRRCVAFVLKHPSWRLSVQAHKYIRLP